MRLKGNPPKNNKLSQTQTIVHEVTPIFNITFVGIDDCEADESDAELVEGVS